MDIDRQQYEQMYKQASKGTKWWVTVPKAFVFGGLICVLGQSLTKNSQSTQAQALSCR